MLTFSPAIAEHEREDVTLPGDLSEAMDAGSAVLPAVKKDISTAGQSQGTKSSTVKASLGVDILGNILGALTGSKLDVSAGFRGASIVNLRVWRCQREHCEHHRPG